ncbi:MAG: SDR family oxidoreductase [Anaerolineales bacterium]|nr:SDR family oxidoreductase [Anaerolineales bacterium]MCX7755068.1 SDR family oxidoreductase [Anaerolineales bacterium]MDW8277579.1 SDR family oxidoreductase [Anaerolineales bacterium]
MNGKILVTGALGNVGAEIVKRLQAAGSSLRAADLSVETIRERFGASVEAVAFDFSKKETYRAAFEGVEKMFLMRPPQISDVKGLILPALDAAQAAGVRHVVFLSLIGIERVKFVPHYKVEEYLMRSPMTWTFLRASFFMQNLNTTHRQEIRERSEIFVPLGGARTSFIDVRDIAAVAVAALCQPGHENKKYDLTGPEALDYWQAAAILSETLGRTITYRNPSALEFFVSHLRRGTPLPTAMVMTGLYLSTRNGMAESVTGDVERVTGQKPIPFRQYARDYQASWQ